MKFFLLLLTLLVFAPNAFGDNIFIIPGSKPGFASGLATYATGTAFKTRAVKDRSTYCRYRSGGDVDIGFSLTLLCSFAPCPMPRRVGAADGRVDSISGVDDAIAFIAEDNVFGADENDYTVTLEYVTPSPSDLIIECFDTTLYGNFNTVTVANPFNFLELSNDSGIEIHTRIVVTKNDGTELSKTNVTIGARQQRDIAIHDLAGAANTFGRITVAHDGALNGLRASITKYTSSFLITASTPFTTRGNEQ